MKAFVSTLHVSGSQWVRQVLLEVLITSSHPIYRRVVEMETTHRMWLNRSSQERKFKDLNAFYLATVTFVCHAHKTHIYKSISMLLYPVSFLYYPFPQIFSHPCSEATP